MKKGQNIWWLILSICGISSIAWLTNTYDPSRPYVLVVFFALMFATAVTFGLFVTNHARHSWLFAVGVIGFFLLRFLELREAYYPVLLMASLISLELYLNKR